MNCSWSTQTLKTVLRQFSVVCCATHHGFEQETNREKLTQTTVVYAKNSTCPLLSSCVVQHEAVKLRGCHSLTAQMSCVQQLYYKYSEMMIITHLPVWWRKYPFNHFSEWSSSSQKQVVDHFNWTIILVYWIFRPVCGGPAIILVNNHFSVSKFSPPAAANDHLCERS